MRPTIQRLIRQTETVLKALDRGDIDALERLIQKRQPELQRLAQAIEHGRLAPSELKGWPEWQQFLDLNQTLAAALEQGMNGLAQQLQQQTKQGEAAKRYRYHEADRQPSAPGLFHSQI